MTTASRQAEVAAVDEFLREPKTLDGPPPLWTDGEWGGFTGATWVVRDAINVAAAKLSFRALKSDRTIVSVSLIFRTRPIWRIDLDSPVRPHHNPPDGFRFGLVPIVRGPHAHRWDDNRQHVLSQDVWDLPYKRELAPTIRRIDQALLFLAQEVNLTIESGQHAFEGPRQTDLFNGGGQ